MPSRRVFWVRLGIGLAVALVVPPVLLVATSHSIPVRVEWWMIALGAVGIPIAPGPAARLVLVVPYALLMGLILVYVGMSHACALGFCV